MGTKMNFLIVLSLSLGMLSSSFAENGDELKDPFKDVPKIPKPNYRKPSVGKGTFTIDPFEVGKKEISGASFPRRRSSSRSRIRRRGMPAFLKKDRSVKGGSTSTVNPFSSSSPAEFGKRSKTKTCYDHNFVPQGFIDDLIPPDENGEIRAIEFTTEKDGEGNHNVSAVIPTYLSTCTDLNFVWEQFEGDNNVFLKISNDFDFRAAFEQSDREEYRSLLGKLDSMTMKQKYDKCIEMYGLSGDEFPEDERHYEAKKIGMGTNIRRDEEKTQTVYYGSPIFLGGQYGPSFSWAKSLKGDKCSRYETVAGGGHIHSLDDVKKSKIINICENGDASEILKAKIAMGNSSQLDRLAQKILEKAYNDRVNEMAETSYKKLEEIAREIRQATSKRMPGDELREVLEPLYDDYKKVMDEIEEHIIQPSIDKIKGTKKHEEKDGLLYKRKMARTKEEREAFDAEIERLNKLIGKVARGKSKYGTGSLISKLLAAGMTSEAEGLNTFALRSDHYRRLYVERKKKGRKPKKSERSIKRRVAFEQRKFEKVAENAATVYGISYEGLVMTDGTSRRIERLKRAKARKWNEFQQRMRDGQEACTPTALSWGFEKNRSRCRRFKRNYTRTVQNAYRTQGRYNNRLRKEGRQFEYYHKLEKGYESRNPTSYENDDYDSGLYGVYHFDGLGDNFSDFQPVPRGSMPFDQNYSMGNGGNSYPQGLTPHGAWTGPNPYGPQQGPPQQFYPGQQQFNSSGQFYFR